MAPLDKEELHHCSAEETNNMGEAKYDYKVRLGIR